MKDLKNSKSNESGRRTLRLCIVVLNGVPASSVAGMYEQLSLAMRLAKVPGSIELLGENTDSIQCEGGFTINPHTSMATVIERKEAIDALILAPIGDPEINGIQASDRLCQQVRGLMALSIRVVSVCTGAFLLANTGAANGKRVSTHWRCEEHFRRCFPEVELQSAHLVVEDGKLMSAGGAMAYQDMCLVLTERLFSRAVALRMAKLLVVSNHRESQSEFAEFQRFKRHGDLKVKAVQDWIESNYDQSIDVSSLAVMACLSERHFKRRFKQATGELPSQYWQKVRIDKAKRLLEEGEQTVTQICHEIGYEDLAFFRALFKRYVSLTPNAYRKRYSFHKKS